MQTSSNDTQEAQTILEAIRQIQSDPALQAEAANRPERVLDRLKLTGVARHAVALGITAMVLAGSYGPIIPRPDNFWVD